MSMKYEILDSILSSVKEMTNEEYAKLYASIEGKEDIQVIHEEYQLSLTYNRSQITSVIDYYRISDVEERPKISNVSSFALAA